ncbi:MAG: hypothetical protein FWD77_00255 [Betaproteobacteria bacterium]|nr:hypothetical protein [Betaproteobacteria bacterium]
MNEKILLLSLGLLAFVLILFGILLFLRRWRDAGNISAQVGAIAEAEVLIAYGQKAQAIAMLENILRDNPAREDIARKLRELRRS